MGGRAGGRGWRAGAKIWRFDPEEEDVEGVGLAKESSLRVREKRVKLKRGSPKPKAWVAALSFPAAARSGEKELLVRVFSSWSLLLVSESCDGFPIALAELILELGFEDPPDLEKPPDL